MSAISGTSNLKNLAHILEMAYNRSHILTNASFTTSETERDYY